MRWIRICHQFYNIGYICNPNDKASILKIEKNSEDFLQESYIIDVKLIIQIITGLNFLIYKLWKSEEE